MVAKSRLRILSLIFAVCGIAIITISVFPILQYEIVARQRFPRLVSPLTEDQRQNILAKSFNDYKDLSSWSSGYKLKKDNSNQTPYKISIPKLKINNAEVSIGGEDLSKSLIQYPGTALPGQLGDAVIFGHSVLPIFFNPRNYMSIFSTLPTLKPGDEILVNTDSVVYKYVVSEMFEVYPNNLSVLDQSQDDSYISLVTCVPPGHPLNPRRLVVRARLEKL